MAGRERDWQWLALVPRWLRDAPVDLVGVVALLALANVVVFLPWVSGTPIHAAAGFALVLVLPGYAATAALFPEAPQPDDGDDEGSGGVGIGFVERTVLSVTLSIALVMLVGLVLNFVPLQVALVPAAVSVTALTGVLVAVAASRRRDLPPERRFVFPYRRWAGSVRETVGSSDTRGELVLNVAVVASVLLATASVGYVVAVPKQGASFTELYLVTETDNGTLVADDYPTEYTVGESRPLVVGVGNHEHQPQSYTVVVELHRVSNGTGPPTVRDERELARFGTPTLAHNETWTREFAVEPTMTGDGLRLAVLLYRGAPPADPTVDNAYRETRLWVTVSGV